MKFAVVSDVHAEQHFDWSRLIFERLSERSDDLDFVAGLGDWTTNPNVDRWDKYLPPLLSGLQCPIYGARGNHDPRDLWSAWSNLPLNYTREIGGARRIFLDNVDWCDRTYHWLDIELDYPADLKFVFMHRLPSIGTWTHGMPFISKRFLKTVVDKKVIAVFCGHTHAFDHINYDGVDFFLSGGGGGERYNVKFTLIDFAQHSYCAWSI